MNLHVLFILVVRALSFAQKKLLGLLVAIAFSSLSILLQWLELHFSSSDVFLALAPKAGYSQGATQYTQAQQARQVTAIKPATPSPATTTFSIYPVSSTVQPVAAAATVVPSYTQSATYSTTAVTYSGKTDKLYLNGKEIAKHWLDTVLIFSGIISLVVAGIELIDGC